MPSIKVAKPEKYDGSNLTATAIRSWVHEITEYLELMDAPEDRKTRIAATYLGGEAKTWYINKYDSKDPPPFDEFIDNFKARHLGVDHEVKTIIKLQTMTQGRRTVQEYANEFNSTLLEAPTSTRNNTAWSNMEFLRGLDKTIKKTLVPTLTRKETLEEMTLRASIIEASFQQLRDEETRENRQPSQIRENYRPRPNNRPTNPAVNNNRTDGHTKLPPRLTDTEREKLRANNGCFTCRKMNAGHWSSDCPEKAKFAKLKQTNVYVKKESVDVVGEVEEANELSDSYSCPRRLH